MVKSWIQEDLCNWLYADTEHPELFNRAFILQPALFAVSYAMARLLMDWGIQPSAVVGHSLGEYVAACIAGIMNLEDALALVVTRSLAMQDSGQGAMLAVSLSEAEMQDFLQQRGPQVFKDGSDVNLAAINAPRRVVLSGSFQAVELAEKVFQDAGVACQRVHVSHAFHSPMMQRAADAVTRKAREITLHVPAIPLASNLTGTWLTDSEALDPTYWGRHMTQAVRFQANIRTILRQQPSVMLEVGPGRILSGLATEISRHVPELVSPLVLSTMRHPHETSMTDPHFLLNTLGRLWTAGIVVDWLALHAAERPQRVPLPTYAFERHRCWPDNATRVLQLNGLVTKPPASEAKLPLAERFYLPSWQRTLPLQRPSLTAKVHWLVFLPGAGMAGTLGNLLATQLEQQGHPIQRVYRASDLPVPSDIDVADHVINATQAEDYVTLLEQLSADGTYPQRMVYLWGLDGVESLARQALLGTYYPLFYLAQALTIHAVQDALMLWVVTDKSVQVSDESLNPVKATMLGPSLVLPQENPHVSCRMVDVQIPSDLSLLPRLAETILRECIARKPDEEPLLALRGEHRWRPHYETVQLEANEHRVGIQIVQPDNTYIITGGLGRIGLALAEHLATLPSKLVLTTRSDFPERARWEMIAASSDVAPQMQETVQRLLKCEAAGADLHVIQADMANASDVHHMLTTTLHHFGEISGIFHAAGLANLQYLPNLTAEIAEQEFAPKLYGLMHLEQAIGQLPRKPKFVVLFSSMAAILGGLAMSAYAAANRFMDAFVQANPRRHGVSWLSINWDDWDFVYNREQIVAYEKQQAQFAMTPAEGIEALQRILAYGQPIQLLVATRALLPRITQWLHQSKPTALSLARANARPDITQSATEVTRNGHHLERHLTAIYQHVLGLSAVDADANFFDLGGDSLLASQILLQLRRQLPQVQIQLPAIFDYPSVREMAQYIAENEAK
jgi:malonyl CoA-acyl carrier protein transacylase